MRKAVLISPLPPYLLATDDDPYGAPASLFEGFVATATADRLAWFKGFLDLFYNIDVYGGTRVSDEAYEASFNVAAAGSAIAAVECIGAWQTDFRADLAKIDVPVLAIQGDQDRVLPIEATGKRLPALIADLTLVVVEGGPHAIPWTHAEEVNAALSRFLA